MRPPACQHREHDGSASDSAQQRDAEDDSSVDGAALNARLRQRGLWPLTGRQLCERLEIATDTFAASALDTRLSKAFGDLEAESSLAMSVAPLFSRLSLAG